MQKTIIFGINKLDKQHNVLQLELASCGDKNS